MKANKLDGGEAPLEDDPQADLWRKQGLLRCVAAAVASSLDNSLSHFPSKEVMAELGDKTPEVDLLLVNDLMDRHYALYMDATTICKNDQLRKESAHP